MFIINQLFYFTVFDTIFINLEWTFIGDEKEHVLSDYMAEDGVKKKVWGEGRANNLLSKLLPSCDLHSCLFENFCPYSNFRDDKCEAISTDSCL